MMRRQYQSLLGQALRELDLRWLSKQTLKVLRVQRSLRTGRPATGPILATVVVTYRCNYRCFMCGSWRRGDHKPAWDTDSMCRLLDALAALKVTGVGFTGGEPLLRRDLPVLIGRASSLGLVAHLNTNGSLVTPEIARALVDAGLRSVNLSLDGARPETHNDARGVPAAFDHVASAARALLAARDASRRTLRVCLVCVVSERNLGEVREIARVASRLGVDALGFLPVHRGILPGFVRPEAAARLRREIEALLRSSEDRRLLDNSPAYLRGMPDFLAGRPSDLRCTAGYTSIVVDCFGEVYPCVPWSDSEKPVAVLDAPEELPRLWHAAAYDEVRGEVERCRGCWWNCHRELDLLLAKGLLPKQGRGAARPCPEGTREEVPRAPGSA